MAQAAAAHAAAIAQAIKASGAIVRLEPADFRRLVGNLEQPFVVVAHSRFLVERYEYLTGYRGLVLYTKSREPIALRGGAEIVHAKKIWVP
ncbi:MAG: hypothetical protein HY560_00270 [Gemmatimonadetes bacterium]|nr:hypothetical protein [Gemmatimonadota bacterium]